MKLKYVSLAMASSVAALAAFALTSCGDENVKEGVKISDYSNEITEEKFRDDTQKFNSSVDLTGGYEYTSYEYSLDNYKGEYGNVGELAIKTNEKYDSANDILYRKRSTDKSSQKSGCTSIEKGKEEWQFQSEGEINYGIDLLGKLYETGVPVASEMAHSSLELMDLYSNAVYSLDAFNVNLAKTKYFNDNDVFTVEMTIDSELKNKYNDEQASEIKVKNETSGKIVIQFYAKDDAYYLAYDGEVIGKCSTINGTNTYVTFDGSQKASGYTNIVKKAQTIEKVDSSKYDYIVDIYDYIY